MNGRMRNGFRFAVVTAVVCSFGLLTDAEVRADSKRIKISLPISGQVPDVSYRIRDSQFGIEFQTKFQDVSYVGEVTGAIVEQKQPGKVSLWFSLRKLRVTHKRTSLAGWPGSAEVGPMDLLLGSRRDLWIAFDLERAVRDGQPRIVLRGTRFRMPKDNWSIGRAKWIRTTGVAMTQQRVKDGLRNGLVKNQKLLEQQVIQMASRVLKDLFQSVSDSLPGKKELVAEVERCLEVDLSTATASTTSSTPTARSTNRVRTP